MKYVKILVPDDFETGHVVEPGTGRHLDVWQPVYKPVLNHGFVGLVDFYGDDSAIVNAARVSYGVGTTKTRSDRGLIRYLLRHLHTTPFEMVDFKFHVKAPIFVFRQWHRHRTFSINEYSARYSEMKDEMYEPTIENLAPQSTTNRQGRDATMLSETDYIAIMAVVEECFHTAYQGYKHLLGPTEAGTVPPATDGVQRRLQWCQDAAVTAVKVARERASTSELPDPYPTEESLTEAIESYLDQNGVAEISTDFPGIARELARMVLPVATYSEMYWKGNMWNLFHFLNLRCDPHAQYEIRVYADAILELIRPHAEWAVEAFEDYLKDASRLSRMEVELVSELLSELSDMTAVETEADGGIPYPQNMAIQKIMEGKGCSSREIEEFIAKFIT